MGKRVGLMLSRLRFSNLFLGELCRKSKMAVEMRYNGGSKEDIETWLRNIIVVIRKKKVIDRLEGQRRGICVQSVLAKWYCGYLTILLEMELRNVGKKDKSRDEIHTKAEVRLRSPRPLDSWRRLQESGEPELGVIICSLDAKQSFDNISPENLSFVTKEMDIAPVLAEAILGEQIGGKYDICFQEARISGIPFDKSIKQGGKESPCLFNLMMRSVFRALQEEWKVLRIGVKTRNIVR